MTLVHLLFFQLEVKDEVSIRDNSPIKYLLISPKLKLDNYSYGRKYSSGCTADIFQAVF